jgi:hypothetical protein
MRASLFPRVTARKNTHRKRWAFGALIGLLSLTLPASANPKASAEPESHSEGPEATTPSPHRAEGKHKRVARVSAETPTRRVAPQNADSEAKVEVPKVEFGKWQGAGYGGYLMPKSLNVDAEGGVDFVVHLNGAMMADKDWRESGLNAIIASVAIAEVVGTAGYSRMFAGTDRLDWIVRETFADLKKHGEKRSLHVKRMMLVSWSAGMGGVTQLLGNSKVADKIDAVVLLDSLHAGYANPKTGQGYVPIPNQAVMGLGEEWVERKAIQKFVRFAEKAKEGKKVFVMASSAILPPNYASCAETATAVLKEAGAETSEASDENERGMKLKWKSDAGQLHARAFKGGGPHDHFDQLHLVGEMVRKFVVPVWNAKP